MRQASEELEVRTRGRGFTDVTRALREHVHQSGIRDGLCTVFCRHTSASLIVCENADPTVRSDLEAFAQRLVPDGDPLFEHTAEGPDDMPAHVRSVLTCASIGIPVVAGEPALGTWQGLYLWEHRTSAHARSLRFVTQGEA